MNYIITFIISFLIIYIIYLLIVVKREKGLKKFKEGKQLAYFKQVYKIDVEKLNIKKFANSLAVSNAFIMATTITIIELLNNIILKMIVGFITLIPLMLITYTVLGKTYKKKEGK